MSKIKARPTTYKGIQMRSRLEADYAADLDRQGYRWEYEPECFASDTGQWLPDFGCTLAAEGVPATLDEVKPAGPLKEHIPGSIAFTEHVDTVLKRMTIAWDSRPDACLRLTFWQYGEGAYLTLFNIRRGALWLAYFGDLGEQMELIWAGMGQYERCKGEGATQGRDVARHWRGLAGSTAAHVWPGTLSHGVLAVYADSEDWAAKTRTQADRLIQGLNLIFGEDSARFIDVQLDEVAR